jgi:hypothetical protein
MEEKKKLPQVVRVTDPKMAEKLEVNWSMQ